MFFKQIDLFLFLLLLSEETVCLCVSRFSLSDFADTSILDLAEILQTGRLRS